MSSRRETPILVNATKPVFQLLTIFSCVRYTDNLGGKMLRTSSKIRAYDGISECFCCEASSSISGGGKNIGR